MTTVYSIVPAGSRPFWILLPAIVILLGALVALVWTATATRRANIVLSPVELRFRGDLYGGPIPAGDLRGGAARLVDLTAESGLRPTSRRLGTGLPGYLSGWVRLADGERALAYLTDWHRVVYIPTTRGYSVLLSLQEPDAFLAQLRAVAPGM
jgi:hypothetical protein